MSKIKLFYFGIVVVLLAVVVSVSNYLSPKIAVDETESLTAAVVGSIPGIEAYFAFDEGTGIYSYDTIVPSRSGFLTNGPIWTSGKAGTGVYLDGVNDNIVTNYSPKFEATGFTISIWVNPSSVSTSTVFRNLVGDAGHDSRGIRLSGDNSKLDVGFGGGSVNGVDALRNVDVNLATGLWQMITVTYNSSTKTVTIYKNGVSIASQALTTSNADWAGNVAFSNVLSSSTYLNAIIDEARFYNRPLSASEVSNLYSIDLGPVTPMPTPTPTPSTSPSDTTAPTISAVATSILTASSIKVTWTTNEASDTQVEYGTTTAYGLSSTLNTSKVSSHSVTLTNLIPATTYYIKVKSKDAAGNLGISTIVFTPDTTAPVISTNKASWLTSSSATITWKTNESSDTQVEYGLSTAYGYSTTLNTSKVTSHSATLASLNPGVTYYLKLKSKDAAGNLGVYTMTIAPDTTAPIVTASSTSLVTATSSKISWTTNETSDTQIEYGTTLAYGSTSPLVTTKVTSHSVSINGLIPETTYYVKMLSRDASGNLGVATMTFKSGLSYQADLPSSFLYLGHPYLSRFPTDTKNRWISDMHYWPLTNKIYIGGGSTENNQTKTDLWSLNVSTKAFIKEISLMNAEMVERFRVLAGQLYIPAYDDVSGLNFYRLSTTTWVHYLVSPTFTGHSPDVAVFDNKVFLPLGVNNIADPNIATTNLSGSIIYLPVSTTTNPLTAGRVENFFEFKNNLYVNRMIPLSSTPDHRFLSKYSSSAPTQYTIVHNEGDAFFPETNKYASSTWMHRAINFKGAVVYGGFFNLHYATSIEPPVANVVTFPYASVSVTDFFDRDGLVFVLGKDTSTGETLVLASPDLVNWTTLLKFTTVLSFSSLEYANNNIYLSAAIYPLTATSPASSLKYTGAIYSINSAYFLNPLPSNTPTVPGVI